MEDLARHGGEPQNGDWHQEAVPELGPAQGSSPRAQANTGKQSRSGGRHGEAISEWRLALGSSPGWRPARGSNSGAEAGTGK
ncbi:hypothetical protein chiPu_0011117 [Chiloscyllium punctatum]|uniref:Uncharacterized protein n=1 Tax=Chiloscyllium punctatum TaxID=137246 RepID=A0A401SQH3_CHIPU|nr:hypothetical protein [Chiloscyllium punctatum]